MSRGGPPSRVGASPDLFAAGLAPVSLDGEWVGRSLDERFAAWAALNESVVAHLGEMACRLAEVGRTRIGMKMLVEVARWEHHLVSDDPSSDYAINNSYASRLARLLMERHPELTGKFETRELRS